MSSESPFKSFYSIQGVLLVPFVSVGLMLFLLGFYILLFGLAAYFLCVRQTRTKRRLYLWWLTTLFALSFASALTKAIQWIITAVLGFRAATRQEIDPLSEWMTTSVAYTVLDFATLVFYILANCIADTILVGTSVLLLSSIILIAGKLYRCFVVWGSTKRTFIIVAITVLILTNVIGFVGAVMSDASRFRYQSSVYFEVSKIISGYTIANAINSLILTFIIAGRIWWSSREHQEVTGHELDQKYKKAVGMVVESGFLYSASLVVHVSVKQSGSKLGYGLDLSPLRALMVGIAPTLIILRTSLRSESAIPDSRMISTLRFGEPPTAAEAGQDSQVHTVDFQQGSVGGSDDLETHTVEYDTSKAQ